MKKHLKFIDGTSDKFWQIEVSGLAHTVTYGKNGTSGTTQTKSFASAEECLKSAEKLLSEKIKKGYSDDGQVTLTPSDKPQTDKQAALQAILDEFDQIIIHRKINDLLPFLQEKSKGHVEALKKHIKKCKQYWMTYTDIANESTFHTRSSNWGKRGDEKQARIITMSAIALFDKTEVASWNEIFWVLNDTSDKVLSNILEWVRPNWVEDFVLKIAKENPWNYMDYRILRRWEENALINYNPELVALSLANYTDYAIENQNHLRAKDFIAFLANDSVAYERDIPQLYNYPTAIHSRVFQEGEKYISFWEVVFTQLFAENKLDRAFFIKNALQIQTKEWSNQPKAFFKNRLEALQPTNDELIAHQETIFTYFHSPFPPTITYGMDWVKQLYEHPDFDVPSFLEWFAPVLMRTDCKAAIKIFFQIVEKISKANPTYNANIALSLADIFVIPDMSLQERATKSILKIADAHDSELKEKFQLYAPQMQGSVKETLRNFLAGEEALETDIETYQAYEYAPQKANVLIETVRLPNDWNDILFQFGKFISSDEVLDGEILLNVFITQRHLFPVDYVEQLQPYWKQLARTYFPNAYKNELRSLLMAKMTHLENMIPKEHTHHFRQTASGFVFLSFHILEKVQHKIKSNTNLSFLSFPTHVPYWVAPKTLIERIIMYQNAQETIDIQDLCIAIARMPRENVEEAIPLLAQLEPEMQRLMEFCLGIHKIIDFQNTTILSKLITFFSGNNENIATWAVAARTFYPTETFAEFEKTPLSNIPFVAAPYLPNIQIKEKWNESKNYQTKQMERSPSWYEMEYEVPRTPLNKLPKNSLYSANIFCRENHWRAGLQDEGSVCYWHSILPQNDETLACQLAKSSYNDTQSEYTSGVFKGYLKIVNRPEFWFSDITTLVFATSFFQKSKEVRLMATETLINLIEKQAFPAETFGKKAAFLISGQYGVLLRFIESLIMIKDVSPQHNSALYLILDSIFKNLTLKEKIPTNFKKLLEHYVDMLAKTQQNPSSEALVVLAQWKDNAALKKLVNTVVQHKK